MSTKNTMSLRAVCAAGLVAVAGTAGGAVLTGSGANLPIPSPNPGEPARVPRVLSGVTSAGFNGTWSSPAASPWIGTFSATGPVPAGTSSPPGLTRYDFSTLTAGTLPVGTIFAFGDVDGGSTNAESFVLRAYDASGTLLTSPWLDEPIGVSGVGTGGGGAILPGNLPGWSWNAGLGEYTIDGSTVTGGNPSLNAWILNNQSFRFLEVERPFAFANFSLSAPPVPTPGAVVLAAIGGAAGLRRRRRE